MALLQLQSEHNRDLQNHVLNNLRWPVSSSALNSKTVPHSFTRSAFLNSSICRSSKYLMFDSFLLRQGLSLPLFVLSTNTLEFWLEYMLLLLHIMNIENLPSDVVKVW